MYTVVSMKSKLSYENILRCFGFLHPPRLYFLHTAHSLNQNPFWSSPYSDIPTGSLRPVARFSFIYLWTTASKLTNFHGAKIATERKKKKTPQSTFFFLHKPTEITSAKLNVSVTSELFCRNFVLCRLNMIMAVSSTRDNQNGSKLCDQG